MNRPAWVFADTIRRERQERLLKLREFDEVMALVTPAARVVDAGIATGRGDYVKGCVRAELQLQVPIEVCDAFFNAPVGYRGQYVMDPNNGVRENHRMLKQLMPVLHAALKHQRHEESLMTLAIGSLEAEDAKLWIIDTAGEEFLSSDELTIHILHPVWVAHAKAAFAGTGNPAEDADLAKAVRGVLAPESRFIDVKGGWIERSSRKERHNPVKADRALHIQKYGWV